MSGLVVIGGVILLIGLLAIAQKAMDAGALDKFAGGDRAGIDTNMDFFWIKYDGGGSQKVHIVYMASDNTPHDPECGYYADIYSNGWERVQCPAESTWCKRCVKSAQQWPEGKALIDQTYRALS